VPTLHGVAFLALIIVMILVAAASGNNLVYGLSFTLFAVYMMTMISTNANLKSLSYEMLDSEDAHAGETGSVQMVLINPNRRARFLLRMKARKNAAGQANEIQELAPQARVLLKVPVSFKDRGVYELPAMQFSTVYPLGLFTAWTNFKTAGSFYAYPKREGAETLRSLDRGDGASGAQGVSRGTQHDDFREHSRYLPGESQHQVDWKVFARHGQMLSKRYDTAVPHHYVLSWPMVSHLSQEQALSQLALWVSELKTTEHSFELQLPGQQVGKGRGMQHGLICLRELARYRGVAR